MGANNGGFCVKYSFPAREMGEKVRLKAVKQSTEQTFDQQNKCHSLDYARQRLTYL